MLKSKNTIKKKLVNYKYRHLVLKEIAYSNLTKFHKSRDLEEYFIQEYGNIKSDLRNIDDEEKENIKKFMGNKKENIENIISLKNQCSNIINNMNSYIRKKSFIHELISNIELEDDKLTTVLNVSFHRNGKEYNKKIYVLMTNKMKDIITNNENNIQVFCDTTYHALPNKSTHFKLWILVAFNKRLFKTVLLSICLIKNENEETFTKIFMYLKERFKFNPSFITMDLCKAEIKAAKKIFDNTNIILCFFHYIQRLIKHLKEIRSKTNSIKEEANNLLANLKLIVFYRKKK